MAVDTRELLFYIPFVITNARVVALALEGNLLSQKYKRTDENMNSMQLLWDT